MNFDSFIGFDLEYVKNILDCKNIKYFVKETIGFKDKDILKVARVIKIENKDLLEITVTYFSNPL